MPDKNLSSKYLDAINKAGSADELYDILAAVVEENSAIDGYLVTTINSDMMHLDCVRHRLPASQAGDVGAFEQFSYPAAENEPVIMSTEKGEPEIISMEHSREYSATVQMYFELFEIKKLVCLPIIFGKRKLGGLQLIFCQENQEITDITEDLASVLEPFAKLLSKYVKEIEVADDSQFGFLHGGLQKIIDFVNSTSHIGNINRVYETVLMEFMKIFPFDIGFLLMPEGEYLNLVRHAIVHQDFSGIYRDIEANRDLFSFGHDFAEGVASVSYLQNKPYYDDSVDESRFFPMSETDVKIRKLLSGSESMILLPLKSSSGMLGVLWFWSLNRRSRMSEQAVSGAVKLSEVIGTVLENARYVRELENKQDKATCQVEGLEQKLEKIVTLVRLDELTGLFNIVYFKEELERRVDEYKRCQGEQFLSLVMLDIDNFNRLNEEHGQQTGDLIIADVARRVARISRGMDIPCRYGGQEFAAILPRCPIKGATIFAERLRSNIANEPIETQSELFQVTVSCGCTEYIPGEDVSFFVNRAEEALRQAKAEGRNLVRVR